jgi:hypothetical protein
LNGSLCATPKPLGPNPRQQLARRDRFCQVIVGTGIEARDDFRFFVPLRQYDYSCGCLHAKTPHEVVPVDIGQRQIEQDQLRLHRLKSPQRILAAGSRAEVIAGGSQRCAEGLKDRTLVVHQQDSESAVFGVPERGDVVTP